MGLLGWIIGVGVVGGLIHKSIRKTQAKKEEEQRRKNSPCRFEDGISAYEFEQIAISAGKKIKRLYVSVIGPVIYGKVQSQSGISEWDFTVDFNDYGHITGNYWLSSDNSDSTIPGHFADNVADAIRKVKFTDDSVTYPKYSNAKTAAICICPYCGERIPVRSVAFCPFCGRKLMTDCDQVERAVKKKGRKKKAVKSRPPKILCKLLNKYFQSAKTARESRN